MGWGAQATPRVGDQIIRRRASITSLDHLYEAVEAFLTEPNEDQAFRNLEEAFTRARASKYASDTTVDI